MKKVLFANLLILSLVNFSASANDEISGEEAQFNPHRSSTRIQDFSYVGSGCPQGSVFSDISPDGEVISLFFSNYAVEKRPNVRNTVKRNCKMTFTLDVPAGWSYAFFSMSVQGYAELEKGLKGTQALSYGYGSGREQLSNMNIQGPYTDDYVRTAQVPAHDFQWSSCQQSQTKIVVNSEILVEPKNKEGRSNLGLMTSDVMENVLSNSKKGKTTQQLGVLWKKCRQPGEPTETSYLVRCEYQEKQKRTGSVRREFTVKARSKNKNKAKEKAAKKAAQLCKRVLDVPLAGAIGSLIDRYGQGKGLLECVKKNCEVVEISN